MARREARRSRRLTLMNADEEGKGIGNLKFEIRDIRNQIWDLKFEMAECGMRKTLTPALSQGEREKEGGEGGKGIRGLRWACRGAATVACSGPGRRTRTGSLPSGPVWFQIAAA